MEKAGFDRSLNEPDGQEFGPYTLVRRLGVGGMAETFEAIRRGPGDFSQRVCVKLVLPFFRERRDFLELFKREARLAAKLRHSNVVGVIDFGEIDGITYMALELVDGTDLATLLDVQPGRRVSPEHVALIGHDIAAALEHAHDPRRDGSTDGPADNAIVHRDISPSNVLVSQRGEILLTDFGVAKAITGTAHQQSAVKGKVPYMSPEQLRSETLDGRADLFALGVVLYESLAGHRPFQGDHDPATIMQILNGDRPSLQHAAPDSPPGLVNVIEQLLEPDREARPESASVLLDMLDPFVPSPRERRGLGKAAAVLRTSRTSLPASNPTSGSAPTELGEESNREASGVAPTGSSSDGVKPAASSPESQAGSQPEPRRPSRRYGWAAVLALVIASGVGLWVNRAEDVRVPAASPVSTEAPAPAAEAPTIPEAESAATPTTVSDATATAKPLDDPAASVAAATEPLAQGPQPGRLSVAVFPWGDVWIDGKHRGRAPIRNVTLPAGRHKVSAGQGKPSKTQVVRLKEGQRRTVQFDLSE